MKKIPSSRITQYLVRLGVFLITAALIAGVAGCDGGGDVLPPSRNLEIRTWYDLDAVRDNLAGNHTLMNDLDSTTLGYEQVAGPTANEGKGWYSIGMISETDTTFTGTLDGQGHEIRDLFINQPSPEGPTNGYSIGLVGVLGQGGVVENIGVVNVTVTGGLNVGGLVGYIWKGTVSDSYSTGNVTGDVEVGGLVGRNDGTVSNSYSTGNVTGYADVGGLIGMNNGGTVSDSYSTGNVTGNEDVGGLVAYKGYYGGTVSDSFWDTQTSGQATSAGGTGKTTAEMKSLATFSDAGWNIIAVALNETDPAYIWNIVNSVTYPFLSWQPV